MIIGVDIGGTKTLIASYDGDGKIKSETSFKTPKDYSGFIEEFTIRVERFLGSTIKLCCAGVPGLLDRKQGIVHSLGNLPWKEEKVASDLSKAMNGIKVVIENDSKLAGLSEARSIKPVPKRALYLTISTGIGGALVVDGNLAEDMIDMEIGKTPIEFESTLTHWEDFASGRAFYEAYGKYGDDTEDPQIWQDYAQTRLGPGIAEACSFLQIDTIIFGGGLGQHSNHFADYLKPYLDERLHSIVIKPTDLRSAKHGKNAVIYGCHEYAKDYLAKH
jgi:predicted NBD/HSP70 family sugar kinase